MADVKNQLCHFLSWKLFCMLASGLSTLVFPLINRVIRTKVLGYFTQASFILHLLVSTIVFICLTFNHPVKMIQIMCLDLSHNWTQQLLFQFWGTQLTLPLSFGYRCACACTWVGNKFVVVYDSRHFEQLSRWHIMRAQVTFTQRTTGGWKSLCLCSVNFLLTQQH